MNRALRILVNVLADPTLLAKFREGNLGCKWLKEARGFVFELVPQMNQHYQQQFNNLLSPGGIQAWKNLKDFCSMPGFYLLSNLLPRHKESSQIYLLLIALLLRKPVSDVPISQLFNLESLDSVFQLSNMDHRHKLKIDVCMDAVNILLTITRILLHPVCGDCMCEITEICGQLHYALHTRA